MELSANVVMGNDFCQLKICNIFYCCKMVKMIRMLKVSSFISLHVLNIRLSVSRGVVLKQEVGECLH